MIRRNKPVVIALCGRAGSGKTTAAQYIVEKWGAKRVSFATPLKLLAMHLWDFTPEQVYGDAVIKETVDLRYGITPREAMQRLGDGARRFIFPNIWIRGCFNEIMNEHNLGAAGHDLFVIDDCRYQNEVYQITDCEDFDGYVVKLVCSNRISTDAGTHPSEAEVDMIDTATLCAVVCSELSEESRDLKEKLDLLIPEILNEKD